MDYGKVKWYNMSDEKEDNSELLCEWLLYVLGMLALLGINTIVWVGDMDKDLLQAIITGLCMLFASVLTGLLANHHEKNKKEKEMLSYIKSIKEDVGRGNGLPLTYQHKDIKDSITGLKNDIGRGSAGSLTKQNEELRNDVRTILQRYEKEDERYRAFDQGQYELKNTLDAFSKIIQK